MALKASIITCWSGRATGISVVSPGINIVLCLMLMSGGLARFSSRRGAVGLFSSQRGSVDLISSQRGSVYFVSS